MDTQTSPGSLESRIGLYWLNRLGVGSLVVGLALALMLSFFTLPAILKIAVGFSCSGLLLFAGEQLIRKTDMKWYGQGLIGGGWSLAFFTGFVAHHLPALRVIGSPALDSIVLLAIATASMLHAVNRRSQTIAGFVGLLGTFTICLTQVGFFTGSALALLNAGICAVAIKMRWPGLLVVGSLGFYGSYVLSGSPYAVWLGSTHNNGVILSSALLIPAWLMYCFSIHFFDEREPATKRALVALSCINASGFMYCMLSALDALAPQHRSLFLFATATVYGLSLWAMAKRNLPTISTINQLLALSLATVAISDQLSGTWLTAFWLAEVAILTVVGLAYEIKEFRWFSAAVAPLAFTHMLAYDIAPALTQQGFENQFAPGTAGARYLCLAAIGSFGSAAAMHRWDLFRSVQEKVEKDTFFYLYFSLAAMLVALFPMTGVPTPWHAALWIFGGVSLICAGLRLPDQYVRLSGHLNLWLAAMALVTSAPAWQWLPTLSAAGALTIAGRQYGVRTELGRLFTVVAIGVISLLMWFRLSSNWLSVFLTAEGFLLVVSGFYLSARSLRVIGLSSFALLVVRLLLLELGKADSLHTVLSFFTAGGVLLAASAVYAWLSARHAEATAATKHKIEPASVQDVEGSQDVLDHIGGRSHPSTIECDGNASAPAVL